MVFSCSCGKLVKSVNELNNVMKDLICPICNTGLSDGAKSISEQVKLDHYIEVQNDDSTEIRRKQIYNYLLKVGDATDSEIMDALNFKDRNCISPRRFELVEMGLVINNGKRLCDVSNKTVTCWMVI